MIEITKASRTSARWYSERRLFLDAEGRVVGEKSPRRVSLLVGEGGSIPYEQAEALGLTRNPEPEPEEPQRDPGDEHGPSSQALDAAQDKAVRLERAKDGPRERPVREKKPK